MTTDTPSVTPCETCFRIQCKQCFWIASEKDVRLIKQGLLTACPVCGWEPDVNE